MQEEARVVAPARAEADSAAERRIVARAMRVGLWVWPAFTALDAWMCFVAYPAAPFGRFVFYRISVAAVFALVYRAARRGTAPIRVLFWWQNLSYGLAALAISLMAIDLGGISSPYMHGISIVALVRAALVPAHWRRSVRTYARIGLSFPLVMALGATLIPAWRAAWLTPPALTVFASHYVFVVASCLLGLILGHLVWSAQEQLYRARRIGRYRLQAPIGRGGMGEVWLAWDLVLHRDVALKLLRVGPGVSAEMVTRFEREARATARLQGPHVVRIFDFGASEDGLYYLAMEYLEGQDLATLVARDGPLPPARAVRLVRQACAGLDEAHRAGIIHRDLKPHNLFLTRAPDGSEAVKLLDFGVARLGGPGPGHQRITGTGLVVGTPAYLAPELWTGDPADRRSDLYALGVTLHFLLTGSEPRVRGEPMADRIPAPIAAVLRRTLSPDPDLRPQSAGELSDALAAAGSYPETITSNPP